MEKPSPLDKRLWEGQVNQNEKKEAKSMKQETK